MTSPAKLLQTNVTPQDRNRLERHLIGWNHLNEMLLLGAFTDSDLRKLIVMETESAVPRKAIIRKLLARVRSNEREEIWQSLNVK